jgi:tetratricopeptide (TPR) repeat protein
MKTLSLFAAFLMLSPLAFAQGGDAAALIKKGDAFDKQLKTKEALAVFLEADALQPNDAEILHRIAKQYGLSMDDVSSKAEKKAAGQKALEYSKLAVASDAKNAKAHLALAISYGRLAPFLESKTKMAYSKLVKEEADKALALDANDDLVYHVLGAWNYELANLNAMLRAVAQLIYGRLPPASNDEAVKNFQKAIALAPNKVANHIELGRTYAAMNQDDLAKAEIEKGLSLPSREKDDEQTKQRGRETLKKL